MQICPVGALTGAAYRFRSRPFDLVSCPTSASTARRAAPCAPTTAAASSLRRLAWDDPEVNEEWNCDKGRFAFAYPASGAGSPPAGARETASCVPRPGPRRSRWPPPACRSRSDRRARRRPGHRRGRLRLREVRPHGARHRRHRLPRPAALGGGGAFLAARSPAGVDVRYDDLESAPVVVLVGFEPEDESPIVFLRLRKAARKRGMKVVSIAPFAHSVPPRWARGWSRPRRAARRPRSTHSTRRCFRNRARSSWSASGSPPAPVRCPRPRGWPIAPGPGWPGCRVGPASAARWTPVPARPAARRSSRRGCGARPSRRGLGHRRAARRARPRHHRDPVRSRRR